MSLKVIDRGMRTWRKRHEALARKPHVKIGIMSDSGTHEGGISMVELAAIHEFGTADGHVLERSFLRSTFRAQIDAWKAFAKRLLKGVVGGKMPIAQALGLLGQRAAADVKKRITTGAGIPPLLAKSTVSRKGSSRPLVDTGALLNSITYVVQEKP